MAKRAEEGFRYVIQANDLTDEGTVITATIDVVGVPKKFRAPIVCITIPAAVVRDLAKRLNSKRYRPENAAIHEAIARGLDA